MIKKAHVRAQDQAKERPFYEPPVIITYSEADLKAALGPAQAGSTGGDETMDDGLGAFGVPWSTPKP